MWTHDMVTGYYFDAERSERLRAACGHPSLASEGQRGREVGQSFPTTDDTLAGDAVPDAELTAALRSVLAQATRWHVPPELRAGRADLGFNRGPATVCIYGIAAA